MAIGPAVANLSEEEYAWFKELELYFDKELQELSRKRIPALALGVKITEKLSPRLKDALREAYQTAWWEKVEFGNEDEYRVWFHRRGFVP